MWNPFSSLPLATLRGLTNFKKTLATSSRAFPLACFAVLVGIFAPLASSQTTTEKSALTTAITRPCSAPPTPANPAKSAAPLTKGKATATDALGTPPACLEVKGKPLEIQEFLQTSCARRSDDRSRTSLRRYLELYPLSRQRGTPTFHAFRHSWRAH